MNSQQSSAESSSNGMVRRALVLGGGGSAGNAWEIGVIAGLFEAGLDVTEADLIVGTSAGSTAAAQISSARPPELLAAILAAAPQPPAGPVGSDGGPFADRAGGRPHGEDGRIIAAAEDAADMRRRLGAAALETGRGGGRLPADPVARDRRRSAARPAVAGTTMLITAVDARTGEPVVFDRHSGVDLVDAVAASSPAASPTASATTSTSTAATDATRTPIWRPGTRGCWCCRRSAAGPGMPTEWGMHLAAQVDELRAGGSSVETIVPDDDSRDAVRRQRDGSVDASAGSASRPRPRQSPGRAGHRVLALTPTPARITGFDTPTRRSSTS